MTHKDSTPPFLFFVKVLLTTVSLFACLTTSCQAEPTAIPIEVIPPPESAVEVSVASYPYLLMRPSGQSNQFGNPIYTIVMFANGREVGRVNSVTGRAHTQSRNRHQPGTEAPLPNGKYRVSTSWIPGSIAEAGSKFLPISPMFSTGRTELGFHVDPSFNKNPKEDGTAGCIGLTTVAEREQLFEFVRKHKPAYLNVQI